MAVKIRLARAGKKKVPFHRIVVVDSRQKRDGAYLDNLGTYDGIKSTLVVFHEDRYLEWVQKGAQQTDSAKKIYKTYRKSQQKLVAPMPEKKKVFKSKNK